MTDLPEYISREMVPMSAVGIIYIFIGTIGLLIVFGSFVIVLFIFSNRDDDSKIIMPTLLAPGWAFY